MDEGLCLKEYICYRRKDYYSLAIGAAGGTLLALLFFRYGNHTFFIYIIIGFSIGELSHCISWYLKKQKEKFGVK